MSVDENTTIEVNDQKQGLRQYVEFELRKV